MNLEKLEKNLKDKPAFQLRQAKETVFKNLIGDWLDATNLPRDLRQKLNQECPLKIDAEIFVSDDKNTVKALITLSDGLKIETVLMRYEGGPPHSREARPKGSRNTVCVSSQVGCPLGCLFCATDRMGFKRNLGTEEIIEQVLFFARYLKKENECISNVVFMGMGEPFLNYDNVIKAARIINNQKEGFGIGSRHVSISTIGITGGIEKLSEDPLQINLAISLHAANNELRSKIVPANKKYSIEKIMASVKKYLAKTGRKVMFEYIMIKGLNDSPNHAKELATLVKKLDKKLYMVNLISYNRTGIFDASAQETIKKFKDILRKEGIEVTQRYKFGQDIKAACGQLAGK